MKMEIKKLENYKNSLLGFRAQNLNYTISNKDAQHAAIASNVIFTGTKQKIDIYSGNLNSEVSDNDEFISGLVSLISRNVETNLIMDSYEPNNISKGLRMLFTFIESRKNITIKKLNDGVLELLEKNNISNHFMIADDKMIRKETCSKNYEAEINFNTSEADSFNDIFNLLSQNSQDVKIPQNLQE